MSVLPEDGHARRVWKQSELPGVNEAVPPLDVFQSDPLSCSLGA